MSAERFDPQPPMRDDADRAYSAHVAIRERMNAIDAGRSCDRRADRRGLARPAGGRGRRQGGLPLDDRRPVVPADRRVPLWYLIDNDRRITNESSGTAVFPRRDHACRWPTISARDSATGCVLGRAGDAIERRTRRRRSRTGRRRFEARHVIVAVPPVMASRIDFAPPLPAACRTRSASGKAARSSRSLSLRQRLLARQGPERHGHVARRRTACLPATPASDDEHPALVVFVGGPLALMARRSATKACAPS